MDIQVSWNFRTKLAKIFHCPLKSVPHSHIKVRELLKGFARRFLVRSGQSNSDSLLILEFIQIQQQLVMPWIAQHAVFTINRCLIRQDGSFRGKSSDSCSSHPSLPKASFESSTSEALLIVVEETRHHWNAHCGSRRSDSQNSDSQPFDQRTAIQFCGVQQNHSSSSWVRTRLSRTSRRSHCPSWIAQFSARSWHTSMTWSFQEVLKWSKNSSQWFRKSSHSSTSASSIQRIRSSFWAEQSRSSRMATSQWNSLRTSLMSCSKSLRLRARSQQQDSNFKLFQKIRRLNVTRSFIENQVSCWKASLDGSAQVWPQASGQGALKIAHQPARSGHQKSHSFAQVCHANQRLCLRHGASASSQESGRQVSGSECQLFRFRLSRLSKIKAVNEWFISFRAQCQPSINKQKSGFNCSFFSREWTLCTDSSSSRVIGDQEFHSGVQLNHFVIFSQHCHSDRFISRKSMAPRLSTSRHSNHIELKYLWIQDEVNEDKLELKNVGTDFNPSDVLTKYGLASVLGQHLLHLIIFKSIQIGHQ